MRARDSQCVGTGRALNVCRCGARLGGRLSAMCRYHNARRNEIQSTPHSDVIYGSPSFDPEFPLGRYLARFEQVPLCEVTTANVELPSLSSQLNAEISQFKLHTVVVAANLPARSPLKKLVLLAFPLLFLDALSSTTSWYHRIRQLPTHNLLYVRRAVPAAALGH
jgi:hypothetical protein